MLQLGNFSAFYVHAEVKIPQKSAAQITVQLELGILDQLNSVQSQIISTEWLLCEWILLRY